MAKAKEQGAEVEDTTKQEKEILFKMLAYLHSERWGFENPVHANYHALENKIRVFLENEVKERLK